MRQLRHRRCEHAEALLPSKARDEEDAARDKYIEAMSETAEREEKLGSVRGLEGRVAELEERLLRALEPAARLEAAIGPKLDRILRCSRLKEEL